MSPALEEENLAHIYIILDSIEQRDEKQLKKEEWKVKFLSAVEDSQNNTTKLEECLASLDSLDDRFKLDARDDKSEDEIARNRGNFVLETLDNGKAKLVREYLDIPGRITTGAACLKDQGYYTPHFLNNVEAVRCMARYRCKIGKAAAYQKGNGIYDAFARISRYTALVDPVYIAAGHMEKLDAGSDPMLRAFELQWELKKVSRKEFEFRDEYSALRDVCGKFGVALLDQCDGTDPDVRCLLESANGEKEDQRLDVLYLALLNHDTKVCFGVKGNLHTPLSKSRLTY